MRESRRNLARNEGRRDALRRASAPWASFHAPTGFTSVKILRQGVHDGRKNKLNKPTNGKNKLLYS